MASAQWQMPFYWHEERKMKPFSYIYKPLIQKCQFIQAKTGNTGQKVEKKGILIAALLSLVTLTYYWTMDTGLQTGGNSEYSAICKKLYLLWYTY